MSSGGKSILRLMCWGGRRFFGLQDKRGGAVEGDVYEVFLACTCIYVVRHAETEVPGGRLF
jgi:hypothetical protein